MTSEARVQQYGLSKCVCGGPEYRTYLFLAKQSIPLFVLPSRRYIFPAYFPVYTCLHGLPLYLQTPFQGKVEHKKYTHLRSVQRWDPRAEDHRNDAYLRCTLQVTRRSGALLSTSFC